MALLIFYVALALSISFLCSIMEAVLLSITPSFVASQEEANPGLGEQIRKLKDDIDRPLAAILSLNTIAHTVGAAGAGAQAAFIFGDTYVGIISGVLTLLILVISEIIPKTLGAVYWRTLTPWVIRLLRPTIWSMWPLVKMAQGLTYLLARGKKHALISREEFTALAEVGAREGVFAEDETRILRNLFRLRSIHADDVMTPRTVLVTAQQDTTVAEMMDREESLRFSRIPLYDRNRDQITGYVLKTDLLLHAARQKLETPLHEIRRDLAVVPTDTPLPALFEQLMDQQEHIALVVGEYGGTAGIVTLEDLVETLLGLEIVDEADHTDDMQELARERWRKRAHGSGLIPAEAASTPAANVDNVDDTPPS